MKPKSDNKLAGYQITAPDWRTLLKKNDRNTFNVILIFILTYLAIGFIMDLYFYPVNPFQTVETSKLQKVSPQSSKYYSSYTSATPSSSQYPNSQYPTQSQDSGLRGSRFQNSGVRGSGFQDSGFQGSGLQSSGFQGSELQDWKNLKAESFNLISFSIIPISTLIMIGVALFSLLITLLFHRKMVMLGTDYIEITSDTSNPAAKQLYNVMEELKIAAGMRFMPKIYIIEADYMNAFASGLSEKSALVAITRGLLEKLDRSELQAVMAHELSHIRHHDIRLTLTVALLSNLILIAIDILFRGILYSRSRNNSGLIVIIILLRFLLPILTILLILYLSRTRELMADSGSVELTRDNEPLARALIKIHEDHLKNDNLYQQEYASTPHEEVRNSFYFYDPRYAGIQSLESINNLFSTHPSLEARLKALGIVQVPKA